MTSKNPRNHKTTVGRKDMFDTADETKIRVVPNLNPGTRDQLDIDELMGLIRASGRIDPLLVRRNTDSDEPALWDLIGGHRRFAAFKRLKAEEGWEGRLRLEEITCTDAEMIILATLDNMGRKDFSPVEEAEAVVKMERMGWTDAQISERLDRSLPWIAERKAIYTASPVVKDTVREGLPTDVGADIAKSGDNEKQEKVLAAATEVAKKMATTKGKGKGRKDWRQNMRRGVAKVTGKKMAPGKRLMRQVQQEVVEAIEGEEINGKSKLALVAIDFAMGEITVEEFRDALGYEVVEVEE